MLIEIKLCIFKNFEEYIKKHHFSRDYYRLNTSFSYV